jgi:DNA-binding CsgD family transcriptional regulator
VEAAAGAGAPSPSTAAALAAFERWADATGESVRRAVAARCRGLVAPRGSETARLAFRTALRLHPPGFERARTDLLFGRELRRSRQPRLARDHLRRAAEDFTAAGAQVWADQAAAELRAAGAPADAPPTVTALTTQQQRIARLVADGATNREVAASLYLSTRTVDHHLRNIFNRLGVRSRTELARAIGPG